jgi:uncharacterized membrane protein YgaE (UPF0421/DUF939 family)
MLDWIASLGERLTKFLVMFAIVYSIFSAALSAIVPMSANTPLYTWANMFPNTFAMSNDVSGTDVSGIMVFIMAIFTFLLNVATGFVTLASGFVSLLPAPANLYLGPPIISAAVVLQGLALAYIVWKLYTFFRSLLSSVVLM